MTILQNIVSNSEYSDDTLQILLNTALGRWAKDFYSGRTSQDLQKLLKWNADINIKLYDGNTLLDYPMGSCDATSIIDAGFSGINQANMEGKTPLMEVAELGDAKLLANYINHGSRVQDQNHLGWNSLHTVWGKMNKMGP
jgi:ankyrin repeat protein